MHWTHKHNTSTQHESRKEITTIFANFGDIYKVAVGGGG